MYEATARTLASPATTWVIVIVMTIVTAFLVSAPVVANTVQSRDSKRDRAARGLAPGREGTGLAAGEAETTPGGDMPAAPGRHAVPGRPGGETDRAERGAAHPDEAEAGR